jgi:hypothetical protein
MWTESLKPNLQNILEKNTSDLNFEKVYCLAYTMVLHKAGGTLYTRTRELVVQHLEQNV